MFVPEAILVERGCEQAPMVRRCLERAPGVPVTIVDDRRVLRAPSEGDFAAGKRRLLLAPRRGAFLEHCPAGTRGLACCNYLVLTFASNCPMDCRYCFLQEYLDDNPVLTAYVNPEAALAEAADLLDRHPERQFRIGTGELADSLALDPLTGLSAELVPFFAARPNALLELKTKTDRDRRAARARPQGARGRLVVARPAGGDRPRRAGDGVRRGAPRGGATRASRPGTRSACTSTR